MQEEPGTVALRRLRTGTADLHEEAERHVRILDPDATDATYARYLGRMLGFHGPMEEAFARHAGLAAAGFDAAARRKQDLLRADLARVAPHLIAVTPCTELPSIESTARAVGAAYVLEGSTLGGPFIMARMRPRLGRWTGVATAFLEGYGPRTGAMWKRFRAVVGRVVRDEPELAEAVAAARDTFGVLTRWLDERPADPPHPFRRRPTRPHEVAR
jgi:heme oxygenase